MKSKLFLMGLMTALLVGCGPSLSHTKDYSMGVGEIIEVPISAISREQTIKVAAKSPGKPIMVHVYLADDADVANEAIIMDKAIDQIITGKSGAEEISLEAKIPASKEAIVRFQPSGPTSADVHLEITN